MSAIVSNQEIVHYEVLGRGRPVIFLHGWAGSWRYWVPAMQAVSYNFRAYALDFWGFGDTARVPENYSLEHQTALLETLVQELGIIGRVAVVGHGLGALIALQYGLRNPTKLAKLMLMNCPLGGVYAGRLMTDTPAALVDWLSPNYAEKDSVSIEAQKSDPQALARPLLDFTALSLQERLPEIQAQTLIVYGANDPLIPLPLEWHPEAYPPNFHSLVFGNSGHFPMFDEDAQFLRLLKEFLELDKGASPRDLGFKDHWVRRVR
ncbi:MAG: alpha/beta hydrolase [Anaerolineae bacterium]|nr:alpha/beta hydrolase [Anaerolineae bacterium]